MKFLFYFTWICFFLLNDVTLISARADIDVQHTWDWASAWDLPLNENKYGHISISSAPARPLTPSDNGISIKHLDSTKDLGITIESSFKPSLHYAQAFKTARAALFLIRRSFVTLTPEILISLCSTLVRPNLEYAIQASSP